jgi:hypothetical protein
VSGIEVTAIQHDADVHVLGYFIDTDSARLGDFLAEQRQRRIARVRAMIDRLAAFGIQLDADAIIQPAIENPQKSAGRPWVARALVAAGYAATTDEAFRTWLGRGKPAFVPRAGATPDEVFALIHDADGLASLAHPVLTGRDEWIAGFVAAGLDALEAYHSEQDAAATDRYLSMAAALGVAVSGGSDYHADESHGSAVLGGVSLPRAAYGRLVRLKRG